MNLDALAVQGDRNLAAVWSTFGRHAGFTLGQSGHVTLASSGLPMAFFNGAFVAGPSEDAAAVIADVAAFFAARPSPFLLWVREGVDDVLVAAARAAGLREVGGPAGMVLASIGPVPAPPASLEIRIASTLDDLRAHRAVVVGGFGMPPEIAHLILGEGLLTDPEVAIAIGSLDGVPVTTALLGRTGETAGVYNVATLGENRGRGFGEAATWAVISEGARRGCTHSCLQSSDAGYPVYRRMGFVDVGRYVQLEGPPE